MKSDETKLMIQTKPVDHITTTIKGVIGAVPIVGPFLSEVVGTLVPNQRIDRIADFAQKLHDRLELLDESSLQLQLSNENFTDLIEESLQQVARSTTNERRIYIANLVANGVNENSITFIEHKHLLRILGELNDIEVIWLIYFSRMYSHDSRSAFREKHEMVLNPVMAHMGSPQKEHDRKALQDSYHLHLERLGLLKANDYQGYDITSLGNLIVRQIGMDEVE